RGSILCRTGANHRHPCYRNCESQNPPNRTATGRRFVSESRGQVRALTELTGGEGLNMAEPIPAGAAGGAAEPANTYRAGNEADFERLYQASYGKILGTLTAMLGDRAAAEDCAQDAFERAFKKWSAWQPIAPAEAWVHR